MRYVFLAAAALLVTCCARMETANFQARPGQEAMVRDVKPAIISRLKNSIVMIRPASRQFRAGRRPVYVIAMYNMTNAPLEFAASHLAVGQMRDGQMVGLKVYTYDELVAEERRRQT